MIGTSTFKCVTLTLISEFPPFCNAISNYCIVWGGKGQFQDFPLNPSYLKRAFFFFLPIGFT